MSKGKVWLTHSKVGVSKAADKLREMGYEVFSAPLIEIAPPVNMPSLVQTGAILIFTSQNGVAAFCGQTDRRGFPVVTVGEATAHAAREAGFDMVYSANGMSVDVTQLVIEKFDPGPVIHCSGKSFRGTIVRDLNQAGFSAQRHIYYDQFPVAFLPRLPGDLTHVMFFSAMASEAYRKLSPRNSDLIAISISETVDNALGQMSFKERHIAGGPNLTSMLTELGA